jgi:hypothetical protein
MAVITIVALMAFVAACGGGEEAGINPTVAVSESPTPVAPEIRPTAPVSEGPAPTIAVPPVATVPGEGSVRLAVDLVPDTAEIESNATYRVGESFTIALFLDASGVDFQAYQYNLAWDPQVLSYVSLTNLEPADLKLCSPVVQEADFVAAGCLALSPTRFTGEVTLLTFTCAKQGSSPLDLRGPQESKAPASKVLAAGPQELPLVLQDGVVNCS